MSEKRLTCTKLLFTIISMIRSVRNRTLCEPTSWANGGKTHCVRGHPLSGDNLRLNSKTGFRSCKACTSLRNKGLIKPVTLAQRFWAKVSIGAPDECWPWLAHKHRDGYGLFNIDNTPQKAHRVAYALTRGECPADLDCCHSCDTPDCCNPAHLWMGTAYDNVQDMIQKGRGFWQ